MAIVHALDRAAGQLAVDAGADGLAHLVVDTAPEPSFAVGAAERAMFVVPTLVVLEAICGAGYGPEQAGDPRFGPYLDQTAAMMLTMADGNFPLGPDAGVDITAAPTALRQLRQAGVTVLAGSDAGTLGVAHGPACIASFTSSSTAACLRSRRSPPPLPPRRTASA